jgi:hypothetical protein
MVYVLYKSPTNQIIIGDSNLSLPNSILPISLYGHDYVGDYGQVFQSNLYSILENFNSGQIVPKPVAGMLWYDNFNYTPGILKIYTTENKWKKIVYTTDTPGYVTITGAKVEGKQLLATLVEANNPVNISWSWQKDGVTFTPVAGTVLNQKTCTITTTSPGLYKATVVYNDDFNTGITLSYSVTVNAGVLVIQPDYDVYVGTKLVATLTDNNTPTNLRWTWTDDSNTAVASTDIGLTSSITPDAVGMYTANVRYFDTINITVPSSLSAQVSVSAKGSDYIGYVKITGSCLLNQPLTATLYETDTISGGIVWVWTLGSDILTGSTVDATGKISTYTPTVNGTYTAQAIYRDASHAVTPAKPQDSVIVDVYNINTPASTTTTTTKAPTTGGVDDCSSCATSCHCCCCSGVSLPCDDETGTSTTNAPSGSTSTSTTNAPSGSTSTSTTNAPSGSTSTSTTNAPSGSTSTSTTNAPSGSTSTSTTRATSTTSTTTRATTTSTTRGTTTTSTTLKPTAGSYILTMTNPIDYEMGFQADWGQTQDFDLVLLTYDSKGVCTSVSNSISGLADNLTDITWSGDYVGGVWHEKYRMKLRLMCTNGIPDNVHHVVIGVSETEWNQFNSMTKLSTSVGAYTNQPYVKTYNMLPTVTGTWHTRILARFSKHYTTNPPADPTVRWDYYVYDSKVLPLYSESFNVGEFFSKLSIDATTK